MLVLGIETSCDETGLALVEDGRKIIGTQLASSLKEHQRYGGVVPEIASRAHVELMTAELENLLNASGTDPSQIDRIAVTHGPGLAGSLVIGVAAAKALALAWKKPLVAVNHLHAHLYAALMSQMPWGVDDPMMGLIISGGHTAIVRADGIRRFDRMGQTRDDAVGEAFDKVAKLLGLGFPGGPEIQRVSQSGNAKAFRFSVPRLKSGSQYDFSLSGIKTAVLYKVRDEQKTTALSAERTAERNANENLALGAGFVADMAASFQESVVEEVVRKTVSACGETGIRRLAVGGGVVANRRLRERLAEVCLEQQIALAVPPMDLCTDNGTMVAGLGCHLPPVSSVELNSIPDLRIEGGTK